MQHMHYGGQLAAPVFQRDSDQAICNVCRAKNGPTIRRQQKIVLHYFYAGNTQRYKKCISKH